MLDVFTNMKRSKRGRPPRKEKRHIVWLTASTFRTWNERKVTLGFRNRSNSEFAEALLHSVHESTQERMVQHTSQQRKRTESIVSPVPCE